MKQLKKYLLLLLALFIAALNFNLILKPLKLVVGGTGGIAVILNHILKVSPSLIILIINVIMLIISFLTLPKDTTYGTIIATFGYPLFVKLTSKIPTINVTGLGIFGLVIIAGIVCGVTGGIIYQLGFSNGGISVIPLLLNKYFHIGISISIFIINGIIVLLGCYYFGIVNCLYSIIIIFLQSFLIRKILNLKILTK